MQNQALRGILFLCVGVFIFSLQDAIIKQVSGAYPLTQVLVIRSLVAAPILGALVVWQLGWQRVWALRVGPLVARSFIMFLSYVSYYMAFPALPLADAVALYFTVPLFVTALAGPFLGERTGWKVWGAVLAGLVGVGIMLQPGQGLFEPAALLSLLSALMYGSSMLMARKLSNDYSASVMSFFQNGLFFAGALAIAAGVYAVGGVQSAHPSLSFLVRPWVWPHGAEWWLMAVCGVVSSTGTVLLTNAYRVARAGVVTPFEYTGILWAPLWGFVFFSEVPRSTTVAGAVLIVGAGLMALRLAQHPAEKPL